MIKFLTLSFLMFAFSLTAFGQIERMQKAREKMDRVREGAAERERLRRNAEIDKNSPKGPKAAVMNVDVQMVLSKADHKTFAEAKPAAVTKITDGEPLWMYLKFNGKLGDYVLTRQEPSQPGKLRYLLFAEIGPQNDITTLNQYYLEFTNQDLNATELKINLASGMLGRNRSMPLFLMNSGSGKPGVWRNEFRLTNKLAVPRGPNDNLAKIPLVFDFSKGLAKYPQMHASYDSLVLRGTTDLARLPVPGTFFDEALKQRITEKLFAAKITPVKFYFAGDAWSQYSVNMNSERKAFGVYTYRSGESCMYGVAKIIEKWDPMASRFGESEITMQNDLPIACTEVN